MGDNHTMNGFDPRTEDSVDETEPRSIRQKWFTRGGIWLCLFFLVKGLLWLILPALLLWWGIG